MKKSYRPESGGESKGYHHRKGRPNATSQWLWPVLKKVISGLEHRPSRVMDLGCGNGSTANMIQELGFEVIGVDHSPSGVAMATESYPGVEFVQSNVLEDLSHLGTFPLILSMEVIEHLYDPKRFAENVFEVLEQGGTAIFSTPYHGYWKNLALALAGKWEKHLNPLALHGHIKFFSVGQLELLLTEVGFRNVQVIRAGRIPPIAKTMVMVVQK